MGSQRQNAALSEQALPCFILNRHAPEAAAVNIGYPVMSRQPLIDERIIRRHQIENAAVFPQNTLEQQLRLAAESLAQIIVEIREFIRVRLHVPQIAQLQPLPR